MQSYQMHVTLMIIIKTMTMVQKMMIMVVTPWPLTPSKKNFLTLKECLRKIKEWTMAAEWP